MSKFKNRKHAGKLLAEQLATSNYMKYDLVLALPRGGVPVAKEIAQELGLPLNVYIVRKLGAPNNPEYGIGAVAEPNIVLIDEETVKQLNITDDELNAVITSEENELQRRIEKYRDGKSLPDLTNKHILLVDDGVATGITAKAAITGILDQAPASLNFVSPVCSEVAYANIQQLVYSIYCHVVSAELRSVGQFYEAFPQITDEEVTNALSINSGKRRI